MDVKAPRKPPSAKQLNNERALRIYAAVLCALILACIVTTWLLRVADKGHVREIRAPSRTRKIKKVLAGKVSWVPSTAHAALVAVYLAVNIVLCFTVLDSLRLNLLASRFGWMAVANTALCVFFGLKNTPLAILSAESYHQLNIFHRITGYTAVFQVFLHAIFYAAHFISQGRWEKLLKAGNWEGFPAALGMLVMLAGLLRHRRYELFYTSHIIGFVAIVILTTIHRPALAKKVPIAMGFIACLWLCDRAIRSAKLLYNLINNKAVLYPLPNGGVRIVMRKQLSGAVPGSHCFLWVPGIRALQMHPFTILSNSSSGLEMVVRACDGFTRSAYELACSKPGIALRASVDGPYGAVPDTKGYDRIVLIAGGSGATFTFGLAASFLERLAPQSKQTMDFIWAVRERENLEWFTKYLADFRQAPNLALRLYVTRQQPNHSPLTSIPRVEVTSFDEEARLLAEPFKRYGASQDIAELPASPEIDIDQGDVIYDKLRVGRAIDEAMQSVKEHHRVLIAACGPTSLVEDVQMAVRDQIRINGPSIELHCEAFEF